MVTRSRSKSFELNGSPDESHVGDQLRALVLLVFLRLRIPFLEFQTLSESRN